MLSVFIRIASLMCLWTTDKNYPLIIIKYSPYLFHRKSLTKVKMKQNGLHYLKVRDAKFNKIFLNKCNAVEYISKQNILNDT